MNFSRVFEFNFIWKYDRALEVMKTVFLNCGKSPNYCLEKAKNLVISKFLTCIALSSNFFGNVIELPLFKKSFY